MPTALSARLLERRLALQASLDYAWNKFFAAPDARDRYLDYMVEVYHYVKFSCPLMALTASRLEGSHAGVIEYLKHHMEEEKGHEELALNDLEALGFKRGQILRSLPARETMALIGTQLYIIHELNPIGHLGYIYAMESDPPTPASVQSLSQRLDLPLGALSCFLEHAEADPGHAADLTRMLDAEVRDAEDQGLVEYNVQITLEHMSDLILALATRDRP